MYINDIGINAGVIGRDNLKCTRYTDVLFRYMKNKHYAVFGRQGFERTENNRLR